MKLFLRMSKLVRLIFSIIINLTLRSKFYDIYGSGGGIGLTKIMKEERVNEERKCVRKKHRYITFIILSTKYVFVIILFIRSSIQVINF